MTTACPRAPALALLAAHVAVAVLAADSHPCPLSSLDVGAPLACGAALTQPLDLRKRLHDTRFYTFDVGGADGGGAAEPVTLDTCETARRADDFAGKVAHTLAVFDRCPIMHAPLASTEFSDSPLVRCGAGGRSAQLRMELAPGRYYAMLTSDEDESVEGSATETHNAPPAETSNYTLRLACNASAAGPRGGAGRHAPAAAELAPPPPARLYAGEQCTTWLDVYSPSTLGCGGAILSWGHKSMTLIVDVPVFLSSLELDACAVTPDIATITGLACSADVLRAWYAVERSCTLVARDVAPGKYFVNLMYPAVGLLPAAGERKLEKAKWDAPVRLSCVNGTGDVIAPAAGSLPMAHFQLPRELLGVAVVILVAVACACVCSRRAAARKAANASAEAERRTALLAEPDT